LLCFNSEQ